MMAGKLRKPRPTPRGFTIEDIRAPRKCICCQQVAAQKDSSFCGECTSRIIALDEESQRLNHSSEPDAHDPPSDIDHALQKAALSEAALILIVQIQAGMMEQTRLNTLYKEHRDELRQWLRLRNTGTGATMRPSTQFVIDQLAAGVGHTKIKHAWKMRYREELQEEAEEKNQPFVDLSDKKYDSRWRTLLQRCKKLAN